MPHTTCTLRNAPVCDVAVKSRRRPKCSSLCRGRCWRHFWRSYFTLLMLLQDTMWCSLEHSKLWESFVLWNGFYELSSLKTMSTEWDDWLSHAVVSQQQSTFNYWGWGVGEMRAGGRRKSVWGLPHSIIGLLYQCMAWILQLYSFPALFHIAIRPTLLNVMNKQSPSLIKALGRL